MEVNPFSPRLLIWGLGISGQAALGLAKQVGHQADDLWGTDGRAQAAEHFPSGQFVLESEISLAFLQAQRITEIILSPGVPRQTPVLQEAIKQGITVMGELEFAYKYCTLPIYAVTGTNGKSTCVHMLRDALRLLGKRPFLGGNVGTPFSQYYLDPQRYQYDCIVLEVSSFQCESLIRFRPLVAGIVNITFSHGERYQTLADYAAAKLLLFKNMQEDQKVVLPRFQQQFFFPLLEKIPSQVVYYGSDPKAPQWDLDFSHAQVVGKHNELNFLFVYQMLLCVHEANEVTAAMQKLIGQFRPIEHRLELCAEVGESYFYNDSKSTNMQSTLTALESFQNYAPDWERWLILGGKQRSSDLSFLDVLQGGAGDVAAQLTGILCMGSSGKNCASHLQSLSWESEVQILSFENLEQTMAFLQKQLHNRPKQKRLIIFSPAFPSYDQYKNFEERGRHFKLLASEIGRI